MRFTPYIYSLLLTAFCIASCQWSLDRGGKEFAVADMKVHRYDKLLDEYISLNSFSVLQKINTDYSVETKFLIEDVLAIGSVHDKDINLRLREYYADTTLQVLRRDALKKFEDMSWLESGFKRGFRRLHKELPALEIPKVYAQVSALNQSVVVGDSLLGFSIDKYMGPDYPLYQTFYYDYQCRSMSPERILPDCFKFYLLSEYPFPWEWHRTLLDHIVHTGKIHWVVSKLLDYDTLEDEIGYTAVETEWCSTHRDTVWNYLISSGHLHSMDPMLVRVYMNPAQYTYPLGVDSPAEIGVWLGVHIVDEYMKKNPSVTMADLLRDTDYRALLRKTGIRY